MADKPVKGTPGWTRYTITLPVPPGAERIEAGAIDGLSIGYRTVRAGKTESGTRLLSEIDLWEVSLVTFPMLPARPHQVRQLQPQCSTVCQRRPFVVFAR